MHKNPSLRAVQKHRRIPSFLYWSYKIATYPQLMLETFLRSRFGRRYYSMRMALKIFFILLLLPLFLWFPLMNYLLPALWPKTTYDVNTATNFWAHYWTWYVFSVAFIVLAIRKKREAMKNWEQPSCPGVSLPFFFKMRLLGRPLTDRFIETIAEPVSTFLIGYILYRFGQRIGNVLMVSSALFSLSYMYAYRIADEKLMDIQDDQQSGTAQRDVLTNDKQPPQPPVVEDVF